MSDIPPTPPAPAPTPEPEPVPAPAPAADKTFTQAELDKIVSDRLTREKTKFADYDDLKAKATKFDEFEAANATELEKANKRADDAEKAAADTASKLITTARRAALVSAATKAKAVDADFVADSLLASPSIAEAVKVAEDGTVSGADEVVTALLEDKKFLASTGAGQPTPGFDGGARPGPEGVTRESLKTMTPRQVAELDPKIVEAALKTG